MDKRRKQKAKRPENEITETIEETHTNNPMKFLPWILLVLSWLGFVAYIIK